MRPLKTANTNAALKPHGEKGAVWELEVRNQMNQIREAFNDEMVCIPLKIAFQAVSLQ